MSAFTAKHRSRCGECDDPIEVGDRATYDEDDQYAIHQACAPGREDVAALSLRRIPVVVCDQCYLTRPCDCGAAA